MTDFSAYDVRNMTHARLLTAAPDLLAVCEEIVAYDRDSADRWGDEDYLTVPLELLSKIQMAIAKAKGERA